MIVMVVIVCIIAAVGICAIVEAAYADGQRSMVTGDGKMSRKAIIDNLINTEPAVREIDGKTIIICDILIVE